METVAELIAMLQTGGLRHGYCDPALWDAVGSQLAESMAAEVKATDPVRFVAAVAGDTASTLTAGLGIAGLAVAAAGLGWLLLNTRKA